MAADPVWKYLNARIQHKHDTATQWGLKPNFIPEAGEIIIYDADSTHDTRFKVGDGQTKISALPFVTGVTSVNGQTGDVALTIPTVPSNVSSFVNDAGYLTSETDPTVPSWAKASSKPSYTASEVGAVPTSRTVNGKALSTNISLTASDVGALPNNTSIPSKTSDLTNDSGFLTSYTETDPTVPSWAKAANKPSYTAQEVGALPSSTTIPSKTSDLTNDSGFLTTVPDMTGADGTNPGMHGLVPAPTATDNTKFLKGDGTWGTPSSGGELPGNVSVDLTQVPQETLSLVSSAELTAALSPILAEINALKTPVELTASNDDYILSSVVSSSYSIKSITVGGWTILDITGQTATSVSSATDTVIATIPASTVAVIGTINVTGLIHHNSDLVQLQVDTESATPTIKIYSYTSIAADDWVVGSIVFPYFPPN